MSTAVEDQYDGEKDTVDNGNLGLVLYSDLGDIASTMFLMEAEDSGEVVTTVVAGAVEVGVHGVVMLVVGGALCHQLVVVTNAELRLDWVVETRYVADETDFEVLMLKGSRYSMVLPVNL